MAGLPFLEASIGVGDETGFFADEAHRLNHQAHLLTDKGALKLLGMAGQMCGLITGTWGW